ncbi:Efflux pump membrane transporter BepE [Stieleria bergensis]|uniref:Efflux pump membrane transporter BepE n=1 Tax=Stieleria bergensis TaxID=2528025 RepID=A0A517T327_9BACT|nr:Efflux pump membrane transporter BepE [Planctomycetes bacterium SV_7m_r]
MSVFFIKRPIFATVISIVIIVAGLVSFGALPVEKFPPITPPTVQVSAIYPGAAASTVAETVATPIEQAVNGVEGMLYMSSTSGNDGSYTLTITFDLAMDIDIATVMVQNLVAKAEPRLPQEVRAQGVTTAKRSTQTLQFITLNSPDGQFNSLFLSNYGLELKDEIARLAGVGDVTVFGAGDYSMRIWLDPRKLDQRGVTTDDVVNAIAVQNIQLAGGTLGGEPAPKGTAFELTINAQGRFREASQFEDIIIRSDGPGQELTLGDIARIELGAQVYTNNSTYKGGEAAVIAIYQLPGANALETADLVSNKLSELQAQATWPKGVEYRVQYDATKFVTASINEVYVTLITAIVLVVAVIYLFLQDWRAALIPVIAIPVSLIGTLAIMQGIGFSLNMLSLFGIVLAIGIVVDDAIVVVENCSRHLADGLAPKEAAIKAMGEITGPVIATTLVLLAVFVPCAFMGGITGELFRQFALTISGSVLISTINALTLSPALCGVLLRPPKEVTFGPFVWFNTLLDKFTNLYGSIVARLVRLLTVVVVVTVGLMTVTAWMYSGLPTGFVPDEDQGVVFVNVQLPNAASSQRTREVFAKLDPIFEEIPDIDSWLSVAGYSLLGGNNGSNVGFSVLVLKPWEERKDPSQSVAAIRQRLEQAFADVPDAILFSFTPPPIDGLGNAGGFQMELQERGTGSLEELQFAAEDLVASASDQSRLSTVTSAFRANVPQLYVDVDRTKALALGVPLSAIFSTLQASMGSAYVNDFTYNNRSYQVRIQAEAEFRTSREDILSLYVRDQQGEMVPLGAMVSVREDFGPDVVRRYNMYRSASINGSAAPGVSSGDALSLMEQLAASRLPDTYSFEWTGMSYQEKLASGGQLLIFGLAFLFVFLVLSAQYESWTSPAAVMSVVPLATFGVVVAVIIGGGDNNTYTQIGIVLLIALASKNAILIVEFASSLAEQGLSKQEAAEKAGRLRFRAIMMTALSSILGFLPLLVASGAGAASRVAVGMAVVGGMSAATVFALLLVPSYFVIFRSLSELGQRLGGKKSDR